MDEKKVLMNLEEPSTENRNSDLYDENDGIYIVIGLQPLAKSFYEDQSGPAQEPKKKQKFTASDPQTLVLYKIRQKQVRFVIVVEVIAITGVIS